jgi:hypothetical protein
MSVFDLSRWDPTKQLRLFLPFRNEQGAIIGRDPVTGLTVPSNQVGSIVPGSGNLANGFRLASQGNLIKGPGIDLGLRLGFASAPSGGGKTALWGVFGVFYDRSATNLVSRLSDNPPLFRNPTLVGAAGALFPQNVRSFNSDGEVSTTMNFSLGLQQRILGLFVLDVSYVGSLSRPGGA